MCFGFIVLSTFPRTDENVHDSTTHAHPSSIDQIQRKQCVVSPISTNSRASASSISSLGKVLLLGRRLSKRKYEESKTNFSITLVDHLRSVQYTLRASSPLPSVWFQVSYYIDQLVTDPFIHNIFSHS